MYVKNMNVRACNIPVFQSFVRSVEPKRDKKRRNQENLPLFRLTSSVEYRSVSFRVQPFLGWLNSRWLSFIG